MPVARPAGHYKVNSWLRLPKKGLAHFWLMNLPP